MDVAFNVVLQGILLGGIYGMIAMGLSLIFGVARIVNFSHGAILCLAMYLTYSFSQLWSLDPYFSLLIVPVLTFILGYIIQRWFINPVSEREKDPTLPVILLTTGIMLFLENLMLFIYGANYLTLESFFSGKAILIGHDKIPTLRLVVFVFATLLLYGITKFLQKTDLGRAIRAVSQKPQNAYPMGIDVKKVLCIAFGLGAAITGVAGVLILPLYYVHPTVGYVFLTKSFVIVVLGGLGSVPGAFLGGILIGLAETLASQFFSVVAAEALVLLLFVAALVIRPAGLLGRERQ
ncbi:MAG: branched-chain amino acid ABC transporter permease [Thermoanaerobacteraceae bacterium]|nr:branched-chain amino acid ABC transporter permease [Thermoanaerobacteraceae bacterium]